MRKTILFAAFLAGSSGWTGALHAQESLAGVGAASAMGATLGAAAAGSAVNAGRSARNAGSAGDARSGLIDEASNAGANGRGGAGGPATQPAPVLQSSPLRWGTTTGQQILSQLAATPVARPATPKRSPAAQARVSRRVARMSKKQRTQMVMRKYHPTTATRPWLSHYAKADQYKITTGVWKFVSTETDRFYYRADAPGMLRQSPNRVIGFNTWQDAMIAGYRPDPISLPTPAREFSYMAKLTRGPQLAEYAEYAYAGQVTPENFAGTYKYVRQAMAAIDAYEYAKPLRGGVIDKIIEATLTGNPSIIPRSVGGYLPSTNGVMDGKGDPDTKRAGAGESLMDSGGKEKRMEEFDTFRNRAGKLANVPANN